MTSKWLSTGSLHPATSSVREDSFVEDTRQVLKRVLLDADYIAYIAQTPSKLDDILTSFIKFSNNGDVTKCTECLEIFALVLSKKDGLCYLQNKFMLLYTTCKALFDENSPKALIKWALQVLYKLADCPENLNYMLENDLLEVLYQSCRTFEGSGENSQNMLRLCLHFIEKLLSGQLNLPESEEISYRIADEHLILHQIGKQDIDIFSYSLRILTLKKHLDFNVVKHSLEKLEDRVEDCYEVHNSLILKYLISILKFPSSNKSVIMSLKFIQSTKIILLSLSFEDFKNFEMLTLLFTLITEMLLKGCGERENLPFFRELVVQTLDSGHLPDDVMMMCLRTLVLLEHKISNEDKPINYYLFTTEELSVLVPTLEIYQHNPEVIVCVCEAIFVICSSYNYDKTFKQFFMDKNVDLILLKLAQSYYESDYAVTSILRAVRGLCIEEYDIGFEFTKYQNFQKWAQIFQLFPKNVKFCLEVILILESWFHCNSTLNASLNYGIIEGVLKMLENFCSCQPPLVFYALNILSRYVPIFKSEGLNAAKLLAPCIKALSVNLCKPEIQVKGLRLINNLALQVRNVEIRDETFMNYCHLLTNNLSEYKDNLQVKKEVFMSLKIYSDTNLYFYQFVIDFKIIDKILHSLEINETLSSTDSELEFYQKNFFLTLKKKCKVEILNEFLFLACDKNYGKSVIALVLLGADVNYEKNGQSCLNRVVSNENLGLVSYLLQNGATKDVEKCLDMVLKSEQLDNRDEIIALILSRHGTSRETGHVMWERLGLGNPKPEWLFKTFVIFDDSKETSRSSFQNSTLSKQQSRHDVGPTKRKLTPAHVMAYDNPALVALRNNESKKSSESSLPEIQEARESSEGGSVFRQSGNGRTNQGANFDGHLSSSESETSDLGSNKRFSALPVYPTFTDYVERIRQENDARDYFKFKSLDQQNSPNTSEREMSYASSRDSLENVASYLNRALSSRSIHLVKAEANLLRRRRHSRTLTGFAKYHKFKVETLSLSENQTTSLESIAMSAKLTHCFSSLKNLYLSRNTISALPATLMSNLVNLVSLSVNENSFREFPFEIFFARKLEELDISHNFINKLHMNQPLLENEAFSSSIKTLKLSDNKIKVWPDNFLKWFPEVSEIYLDHNSLATIPDVGIPNNVAILDLSCNKICSVSQNFLSSFVNVKQLNLASNSLKTLPEESAQLLTNLTVLDLSANNLGGNNEHDVPNFVLKLRWLRDVNLSKNQLRSFPKPLLWNSNGLTKIRCSENHISSIDLSDDLANFDQVTDLYFDYNDLKVIPNEICNLKKLETLDVSHNTKIKRIPSDLYKCESLRRFYKIGVNLANMPLYVQRGNTGSLMKYLQERARNSSNYYAVKMLVMGHAGRGKTSTLRKLMDNYYELNSEQSEPNTFGIEISEWIMRSIDRKTNKPVNFTINCWDFAGQEHFFATHQVFASKEALYMVVYNFAAENLHEELNLVSSWLYNIHARGPNAPTIIVGTHVDIITNESDRQRRKNFCYDFFTHHFFSQTHRYTYAFVGLNASGEDSKIEESNSVSNLRSLIRTKLAEFKSEGDYFMGRRVPIVYQKLEEAVISYKDRIKRENAGIKSAIDSLTIANLIQKQKLELNAHDIHMAMKFMNSTGTVITFPDMMFSRSRPDIYFLDPQWLCGLMSRILIPNSKSDEIIRNSVITYDGLCIIYLAEISLLKIYIRLMERFCILIPIAEKKWLIPNRLPQKPDFYTSQLNALGKQLLIQRVYSMLFLPESLMPLLLARIVSELQDILPHPPGVSKKNRNYVTIDYFSNYVEVHVLTDPVVVAAIEVRHGERIEIVITVPMTSNGGKVLGNLIDHFDFVINESFHGISPQFDNSNKTLFDANAVCPHCISELRMDPNSLPTLFPIEDLANKVAQDQSETTCNLHPDYPLSISSLAPDLTMSDFSDLCKKLSIDNLDPAKTTVSRLGAGGFGTVFRVSIEKSDVAVKVFGGSSESDVQMVMRRLANLRKELKVMVRLRHPSILSALGFTLMPQTSLVLELAPYGSLASVISSGLVKGRALKQKILCQVAKGLTVLHDAKIIYRDLKPENVLVFSLSLESKVNAKIADYGIACHVGAMHISASVGTPGYKAPEQIKGRYSIQSDIYAFGIVAYYVVTNGTHPFEDIHFADQIDKAVLANTKFPSISERGAAPWPDMEDLIKHCTAPIEENRPESKDLIDLIRSFDAQLMRRSVKLPNDLSDTYVVNCITAMRCHDDYLRLLVATGSDKEKRSHVITIDYNNTKTAQKAVTLPEKEIMSIRLISETEVLLGTLHGSLYKMSLEGNNDFSKLLQFPADTILSIVGCTPEYQSEVIMLGMASGTLVCIDKEQLLCNQNLTSYSSGIYIFKLASDLRSDTAETPICNLINTKEHLVWISCGSQLLYYEVFLTDLTLSDSRDTVEMADSDPRSYLCNSSLGREIFSSGHDAKLAPISRLVVHDKHIVLSRIRNPVLETYVWIPSNCTLQLLCKLDLSAPRVLKTTEIPSPQHLYIRDIAIVSHNTLWVSLKSGHIIVLNLYHTDDTDSIKIIKRHYFDAQLLFTSEETEANCDSEFIPLVFSIGKGFMHPQKLQSNAQRHSNLKTKGQSNLRNRPWTLISWKACDAF